MNQSPHSQGIDTIQTIPRYEVLKKMAEKMGLTIEPMPKSNKYWKTVNDEVKADVKTRLMVDKFTPIIEVIKLPKVNPKDKSLYISIVRNIPILFDVATKRKTSKDAYCLVTFAGLHQPQKKIKSEAMKIISKFLKRKAFKLHRVDFVKDIKDPKPIDKEGLKAFKERCEPYSKSWVILPQKNKTKEEKLKTFHTSYYINNIKHRSINKIIYYDKYNKSVQKKENVSFLDCHWKRLEVVLKFDVTRPNSHNFMDYINSMDFEEDFSDLESMAKNAKIKKYSNDYLEYQINSFIDNRFFNNKQSKKQFNISEALEHFNKSEFIRYVLPI